MSIIQTNIREDLNVLTIINFNFIYTGCMPYTVQRGREKLLWVKEYYTYIEDHWVEIYSSVLDEFHIPDIQYC